MKKKTCCVVNMLTLLIGLSYSQLIEAIVEEKDSMEEPLLAESEEQVFDEEKSVADLKQTGKNEKSLFQKMKTRRSKKAHLRVQKEFEKQQKFDEKDEEIFSKDQKELADQEEGDTYEERLKEQDALLKKLSKNKKSFISSMRASELEILNNNSIVITQESLDNLKATPYSGAITVNVLDPENLRNITIQTLNSILSPRENNFISGKNKLFTQINGNDLLKNKITDLCHFLSEMSAGDYDQQIEAINQLQTILDESHDVMDNDSIFIRFIYDMCNAYRVLVSRTIAQRFVDVYAKEAVQSLENSVNSASVSAGLSGNIHGIKLGAKVTHSETGQSSQFALWTSSKVNKIDVSAGASVGIASLTGSVGVSQTVMMLLNSIEQTADWGGELPENIKKISKVRDYTRAWEMHFLSQFETAMALPKILGVLPQTVDLIFEGFTKTAQGEVRTINSKEAGIGLTVAKLGFTIKGSLADVNMAKRANLLDAIDPDLYDEAGVIKHEVESKLNSVERFLPGITSNEELSLKQIDNLQTAIEISLNTVLGDIKMYNSVLSSLAYWKSQIKVFGTNKAFRNQVAECEDKKHEIEKRWSAEGREETWRSFLLTAVAIREHAKSYQAIELAKRIRTELQYLSNLFAFSKDSDTKQSGGTYTSETKVSTKTVSGTLSLPQDISLTFEHNIGKAPYVSNTITLPTCAAGIIGKGAYEIWAKKTKKESTDLDSQVDDSMSIVQGFQIVGDFLKSSDFKLPFVPSAGSADVSYTGNTTISAWFAKKAESKGITPMCYQLMTTSTTNIGGDANVGVVGVSAKFSKSIGKRITILGDDTLAYMTPKYNALVPANKKKNGNNVWENFCSMHESEIGRMLINLADSESNISHEIEQMKQEMEKRDEKKKMSSKIKDYFEKLTSSVTTYKENKSSENYRKAFDALNEVLELNRQSLTWKQ